MTMRKTVLFVVIWALCFQPSVRSEPRATFETNLADDLLIRLTLEIDFMRGYATSLGMVWRNEPSFGLPLAPICSDCPFEADIFTLVHETPINPFVTRFH